MHEKKKRMICYVYYTSTPTYQQLTKSDMLIKSSGQKMNCTQFLYKMAAGGHLGFRTKPKTTRSRETIIPNITEKFREDRFINGTCSPCCVDRRTDRRTTGHGNSSA